ncbi:MAG: DoxX family protein [Chitinophagaceae bacterium]|nr:MAG: DoxX family protein [Chitinophagaceae bacterium]
MKYALIGGRFLFSLIFILSATGHFKAQTIAFAEMKGLPLASVLVPLSGIIELIGGLSILIGYRAKIGAWLLVVFLLPVTFTFHQFWTIQDPMARQMEMAVFLKNMSMLGGALILAYFGTGAWSVDGLIKNRIPGKQAIA